ncbi:MAG: VWA domain-containing protein, partial [Planctomycetes bacterium]|nr:VWA domain-containing protein [Planctomycetota bacterium]
MLPDFAIHIMPALGSNAFSYRFAEAWPAWWIVAGGLVFLAYIVYKYEIGTALPRHKVFLGITRALALLLLLAMIFRPVRVSEQTHIKDSVLAVMVDTSLSMEMRDECRDRSSGTALAIAAGIAPPETRQLSADQQAQLNLLNRAQLVARVMDHTGRDLLRELQEKCTPRLHTFSAKVDAREWPDEAGGLADVLKPEGRTTGIGDSIRDITRQLKGQRIAGLVIITDGQSNIGRDPVAAAKEYALGREEPFPVFTVGVGDPAEPKDIEVLQIFGNDIVFAKDHVLFNVAINSSGFAGRRTTLRIKAGDRILAAESIELKDNQLQQIPMRFKIDSPGKYECTAVAEPLDDEITTNNNQSSPHLLEVVDRSVQILVVAEKPTWEYRYLKNYLIRDTSMEVSLLLQSADPEFFQEGTKPISEFPKTREELFAYDVVVLLGANAARLSDADLRNLHAFVETVGGGLLVAAHEDHPPSI